MIGTQCVMTGVIGMWGSQVRNVVRDTQARVVSDAGGVRGGEPSLTVYKVNVVTSTAKTIPVRRYPVAVDPYSTNDDVKR